MSALNADILTFRSRNFYERTKIKIVISTISAAAGFVTLGFASHYGGISNADSQFKQIKVITDDNIKASYQSRVAGSGFACFLFIVAFILFIVAAVFFNPLCCGSVNERKIIRSPQEIEMTDPNYSTYQQNSNVSYKQASPIV